MSNFILFDIGANWGVDSLERTKNDPSVVAYAFEPTPELVKHLRKESAAYSDRYFILEAALSNFDGSASFFVAAHADWGTSSLLEFSDDLFHTWPNRGDFYVDRQVEVQVLRFDNWYENTKPNFTKIDFFHCDTQGSDLKVLEGMGDYIQIIEDGVVEVPQSEKVKLYKGQHTKEQMLDFLSEKGYEVYRIESQQNEDNLFFRKK